MLVDNSIQKRERKRKIIQPIAFDKKGKWPFISFQNNEKNVVSNKKSDQKGVLQITPKHHHKFMT